MPRDFLPAVYDTKGLKYRLGDAEENLVNCIPWVLHNGEIGACPRDEISANTNTPDAAADRGRGITTFAGENGLYLTQTHYVYNGGSTDLTDTSSPGYAGNTGFNEEYTGSFIEHKVSGVTNLFMVNAGHSSTHASANHGNVWYAADGASAPASISDANMPGNNGVSLVRGGASIDGYLFVGDITGKIHNSDLNALTFTAANFLTAERDNGIGVYIGRHHDSLVSISTQGMEFFYNAGNATGSPLARRADIYHSVGCFYPNSIVEVGDVIYFVGSEQGTGWTRVYKLQNFQLSIISDPKLEALLKKVGGSYPDITALDSLTHEFWVSYCTLGDAPGLLITFDTQWTYYWHEQTNIWCRWDYRSTPTYTGGVSSGSWAAIFPIMSHNGASGSGGNQKYQFINGHIGSEAATDNDAINDLGSSNAVDVFIQFPRWDAGTGKKKKVTGVWVIAAPIADASGANSPISADLRWFDYKKAVTSGPQPPDTNYTTGRAVELNVSPIKISRCGTTRERSWILDWPEGHGPVSVVKGIEIEYEIVGE